MVLLCRLLHVRNANCQYTEAEGTWKLAQSYLEKLTSKGHKVNRATLLAEHCALLFAKSQYDLVSVIIFSVVSS